MVKLNALSLPERKGETKSIQYENIDASCQLLECTPNELFLFED